MHVMYLCCDAGDIKYENKKTNKIRLTYVMLSLKYHTTE
jgi:hypothetical protein